MKWYSSLHDFSLDIRLADALNVAQPGPADSEVRILLRIPRTARQLAKLDPESIRAELRECGAWDAEELTDDISNQHRLLWIACCEIAENYVQGKRR